MIDDRTFNLESEMRQMPQSQWCFRIDSGKITENGVVKIIKYMSSSFEYSDISSSIQTHSAHWFRKLNIRSVNPKVIAENIQCVKEK